MNKMVILLLAFLTIISCYLFELAGLRTTMEKLLASYRKQFQIISDKSLKDQERQYQLLQLIKKQMKGIISLILGILLFIAPFLSLYIIGMFNASYGPDILITWSGLLTPVVAVFLYILLKRIYGKLFGNR